MSDYYIDVYMSNGNKHQCFFETEGECKIMLNKLTHQDFTLFEDSGEKTLLAKRHISEIQWGKN